MRAILDRTSLDEYDFTMLGAFGPVNFVKATEADGLVSTTLFYGIMNRVADDAAAAAGGAVEPVPAVVEAVPEAVEAGPAAGAAQDEVEDDDDDDDEEDVEDVAAAAAGPAAPAAIPGAATAPPVSGPAPPDSYDDQWFALDRAAELLTDEDQLQVLQQTLRVLKLVAKVERTPLSSPDVRWPAAALASPAAAAALAPAAVDTRLPVTVLSGFLGGT